MKGGRGLKRIRSILFFFKLNKKDGIARERGGGFFFFPLFPSLFFLLVQEALQFRSQGNFLQRDERIKLLPDFLLYTLQFIKNPQPRILIVLVIVPRRQFLPLYTRRKSNTVLGNTTTATTTTTTTTTTASTFLLPSR